MKKVLVTGGAGYIGSHTVLSLLHSGFEVVVIDDLSNSSRESLIRVEKLAQKKVEFIHANLLDKDKLKATFDAHDFSSVIHFAGLKAVGESMQKPLSYYQNNLISTLNLCQCMAEFNVNKLVFSSSATVYGEDAKPPYTEELPLSRASSPYGQTKVMIEQMLQDIVKASTLQVASLRYFNPIGADKSGLIGEDPLGIPNNLMPFIAQVAVGKRDKLSIFGGDYPTEDGTCERDYIHVSDLANGHVKALQWLNLQQQPIYEAFNLGTGSPFSVLAIVKSFIQHTGVDIPFEMAPRRSGDLPAFWAQSSKAESLLNWQCQYTLADMMKDTWHWQSKNPQGFLSE
ncbi:UDP-glucose 4-epimerase GalE [Pseudoalteromonas sp. A601]|uniref:UDP-glucose 4-epimerase GalE n=1 Tax=Pseudoalteromonas sp. A601 TaxID=1967839 RepID=UPI000B3CF550|nr:UDP-glucose 4-epimerase GalE [Pseudoalteromonas sp. A601]OUS72318.1 UDP-glucose 4-epimerase GalE [Pseudoalteromonas sp. A601]